MYRIPSDLDLSHLIDKELSAVQLDQHNVILQLYPEGDIHIEGDWRLTDSSGHTVDEQIDFLSRDCFRIHKLLGAKITGYQVESETCLAIKFDAGFVLRLYDNSEQYESFSISPDIYI